MSTTATRLPRPAKRLESLEGLRAAAAVAVMLTHVGFLSGAVGRDVLPGVLSRLDVGVAIFFVLSGFLLYRPHVWALDAETVPDLRSYAVHRAARLVPAWLLAMSGAWLIVPASRDASAGAWTSYLTLTQIYRAGEPIPSLNQMWSLATEVSFYVALPMLAVLARGLWRRRPSAGAQLGLLAALAICAWVFRAGVTEGWWASPVALQWLPAHLDWFAAGMALAVLSGPAAGEIGEQWRRATSVGAWPLRVMAVAAFALTTTSLAGPLDLSPPTTSQQLVKHLSYGMIGLLLVAPLSTPQHDGFARFLASPPLRALGTISYGIFLWHLPVLFAVRQWLGLPLFGGGFWTSLALTFPLSVLVARISWVLVERPLLRLARAYAPRRRGSVRPATVMATTTHTATAASSSAAP